MRKSYEPKEGELARREKMGGMGGMGIMRSTKG
jgi:hypothetical protein